MVSTSARRRPGLPGPFAGGTGGRTDDMWPNRADPVSPSVIGAGERHRCRRCALRRRGVGLRWSPRALFPEVSVPGGSVAW